MEIRKVFRAGNSLVVSLPQRVLDKLGLQEGSQVTVTADPQKGEIVIRPFGGGGAPVSDEFARLVEEFVNEYAAVLQTLKK